MPRFSPSEALQIAIQKLQHLIQRTETEAQLLTVEDAIETLRILLHDIDAGKYLIGVTDGEARAIIESLRQETREYREKWEGYEHRLAVPWLLEQEAFAKRIANQIGIE